MTHGSPMVQYKTQISRSLSLSRCLLHDSFASAKRRRGAQKRLKFGPNGQQMAVLWLGYGIGTSRSSFLIPHTSERAESLPLAYTNAQKGDSSLPFPPFGSRGSPLPLRSSTWGNHRQGNDAIFGDSPSSFFRYLAVTIEKKSMLFGG